MPTYTSQPDATAGIDTVINEALPTTAAATSPSGNLNSSALQRRPLLLKFDLSSITAGSTINSATLSLWNAGTNTANRTMSAYAILAANSGWVEGATWDYANPSTVRWAGDTGANGGTDAGCSVAGTDYNATAMGSVTYIANAVIDTQLDIVLSTSQVAAMVSANYGIIVWRVDTNNINLSIRTSDYVTDATKRPKLVIDYTAGGGAQTVTANVVASTGAVYSPTVTTGAVTVAPTFIASGASVYALTVAVGAVIIAPNLLAGGAIVYSPSVSLASSPQTIVLDLIVGVGAVYSPIVIDASIIIPKLDVTLTDVALVTVDLADYALVTVRIADGAMVTVALSDSTR